MSSAPPRGVLPLAVGGPAEVTFACSVAGQAAVAAAVKEDKQLVAGVAGLATIADSLSVAGTQLFQASIAGQAAIAAALKEDKRIAALVAGGATITVNPLRVERLLQAVVSGQATVLAALTVESGGGGGALVVKDVDQTVHIVSTWR